MTDAATRKWRLTGYKGKEKVRTVHVTGDTALDQALKRMERDPEMDRYVAAPDA